MNREYVALGFILLLIAGFVGADSISSTIVCNGASWVSSSVVRQGHTYAAHLFTTDLTSLIRDLTITGAGQVQTRTIADSSGPMGIDEYSGQMSNATPEDDRCVFDHSLNRTGDHTRIRYLGLLGDGMYASSRTLSSSGTSASTMVNGTGMVLARAVSGDGSNETTHGSDVAGRLNMTEEIIFGGLP